MNLITSAFNDPDFKKMVQENLPKLFKEARAEAETYSNIMAVGSHRKKKIIGLLIKFLGSTKVDDVFSTRMSELDIRIDNLEISIKTISNNNALKITWTTEAKKVAILMKEYIPRYDIILARINWNMKDVYQPSGLFFISKDAQIKILEKLGRDNYIKPPKEGTNAKGMRLTKQAFEELITDDEALHIDVDWKKY
jgi:hypothetical protein